MTSYPYKISKSSRQSNRPKASTRSSSGHIQKLQQVLSERGSQSIGVPSQPSLPQDTQVWHNTAPPFESYLDSTDPSATLDPTTTQASVAQQQQHQPQHPLQYSPFQSPPPQQAAGAQGPASLDQVAEEFEFKSRDQLHQQPVLNPQDMRYAIVYSINPLRTSLNRYHSSLSFMAPSHFHQFETYGGPQFDTPSKTYREAQLMDSTNTKFVSPDYMLHSQHQGHPSHQLPHPHQLPPATSSQSYSHNYTASPNLLSSENVLGAHRRTSNEPSYQHTRRISNAPSTYEPPSRGSPASVGFVSSSAESNPVLQATSRSASDPSTSFAPPHSGVAAPSLNPLSYSSSYQPSHAGYSSGSYDMGYGHSSIYGHPTASRYSAPYLASSEGAGSEGQQHHPGQAMSNAADPQAGHVRILNTRPKPQCWEHGCNGRQFSTFSNLLRHQREKSGTAAKSVCPRCGAEFTRTTARNGHMENEKCKPRRASNADSAERKYSSG